MYTCTVCTCMYMYNVPFRFSHIQARLHQKFLGVQQQIKSLQTTPSSRESKTLHISQSPISPTATRVSVRPSMSPPRASIAKMENDVAHTELSHSRVSGYLCTCKLIYSNPRKTTAYGLCMYKYYVSSCSYPMYIRPACSYMYIFLIILQHKLEISLPHILTMHKREGLELRLVFRIWHITGAVYTVFVIPQYNKLCCIDCHVLHEVWASLNDRQNS